MADAPAKRLDVESDVLGYEANPVDDDVEAAMAERAHAPMLASRMSPRRRSRPAGAGRAVWPRQTIVKSIPDATAARAHAELMVPVPPMKRTFTSRDGSAASLDLYAPLGYVCHGAMKASVRWLRELCPQLPDDAALLGARFTAAGLEVEGIGGIRARRRLVRRGVGDRDSSPTLHAVACDWSRCIRARAQQDVVCGAPNVPAPGGLVVLAPLGVELPAKGLKIERRVDRRRLE